MLRPTDNRLNVFVSCPSAWLLALLYLFYLFLEAQLHICFSSRLFYARVLVLFISGLFPIMGSKYSLYSFKNILVYHSVHTCFRNQ